MSAPEIGQPGLVSKARRTMRVNSMSYGARDILLCELVPIDGVPVEAFTAGAHVDVHLPGGLVRQYSLANDPAESERYIIGVKKEAGGRGGSRYIHERLRVGDQLEVGVPRNNFPLAEDARHTVFLAGGIGITPIRSMIARAGAIGLSWELHYAVRDEVEAVFPDEWRGSERAHLHVDKEHGGRPIDLSALALAVPSDAHVYCCGPAPMIDAFSKAFKQWPGSHRHVEHFGAVPDDTPASTDAFTVVLARSGLTLDVAGGQSILEVVRAAGIDADASCEQGVCGACEVKVLEGVPEHRDLLLSPEEKQAGKSIMICCSRSRSSRIVLDL
ncbi:PDR/VanB family oxidoreductase [Paraburkholderia graminis]|uniref:PDR/VanB family oxidoreductase n=1 Tax=Paraburkholderia graminis TaxID=60548 RepID=UPI0038BC9B57